jgi:hypothetical protein
MRDLHRNHGGDAATSVYNAVINAWGVLPNSEDTIFFFERSPRKALKREMEEYTDDSFVPRPNRTYNTCFKAMRNGSQEEAARAEQTPVSEGACCCYQRQYK